MGILLDEFHVYLGGFLGVQRHLDVCRVRLDEVLRKVCTNDSESRARCAKFGQSNSLEPEQRTGAVPV